MMWKKIVPARFSRFALVGGVATVVHFGVMILLIEAGIPALSATATGAMLGALASYVLQRRFAFRSCRAHGDCLPGYVLANLVFLGGNVALFAVFQTTLQLPPLFAQLVTTALMALLTYQTYLRVIFHERVSNSTSR